jgi:RING-like zinc finger
MTNPRRTSTRQVPSLQHEEADIGHLNGKIFTVQASDDLDNLIATAEDLSEIKLQRNAECRICFGNYKDVEKIWQATLCNHAFHFSCIFTVSQHLRYVCQLKLTQQLWHNHSDKNCPICRGNITKGSQIHG